MRQTDGREDTTRQVSLLYQRPNGRKNINTTLLYKQTETHNGTGPTDAQTDRQTNKPTNKASKQTHTNKQPNTRRLSRRHKGLEGESEKHGRDREIKRQKAIRQTNKQTNRQIYSDRGTKTETETDKEGLGFRV